MYNVLVVDDEPYILNGLESIIDWEEYGLEIAGLASNGAEAREILLAKKIDILLTDIRMPKMNGLELIGYIRRNNLNIRVIILSGYDEFNYIKEAIKLGVENYLLKPVNKDELSLTLLSTIEKIESEFHKEIFDVESKDVFRQNLLYRWVTNNISGRELVERASVIGINLESCDYMAVNMYMMDGSNHMKSGMACNAILEVCSEFMTKDLSPLIFYDLDSNIILLFSNDDIQTQKTLILDYLQKCIKKINTSLKINVFTTIGSIEHDYQTVCRSYLSSVKLQEYSLVSVPNTILDYYSIQASSINNHREINFSFEMEALNKNIVCKRKDQAFSLIENLYNQILQIDGVTPGDIQNFLLEVLYNISSTYKKAVNETSFPYDLGILFSDINKIKTSSELIGCIKTILSKTIDYISIYEDNQNPLIKHIIHYINSNCQEPVSLKSISHKFNVNTSYLGQLFKNETGELFTNYLNRVRIQKAKELLVQTNFKIYDISNKVGYTNQSLFFRTFKKLAGISPDEYRETAIMLQKQ